MKRPDINTMAFLGFLVLVNMGIRVAAVAPAIMPLNDGGLFYKMIADLLANRLQLPIHASYNGLSVPFAYPPLAFYVYAGLQMASGISLMDLMHYGPPIFSTAAIPAFYFLAQTMLNSRSQAALATLVFSFLPREFEWLIMGGGVTRGIGLLFALLAMRQAYVLAGSTSRKPILPMIILGGLVIYTHPEAATHTLLSAAVFYVWRDRTRRGLRDAALVICGILAITAPWWAVILTRHGAQPFLAAAAAARDDSYNVLTGLVQLFRFNFADEPFLSIFTVIGLLGLILKMARRDFLLPAWLLAMHTFEPRGGALFMMIPLSMGAGFALVTLVLPGLRSPVAEAGAPSTLIGNGGTEWLPALVEGRAARWLIGFLVVYGSMAAFFTGWRIQKDFTLSADDIAAFNWVRANTEMWDRFALVTQGLPLRDASSEWFPAFTGRQSLATVFGLEWIRDVQFTTGLQRYRSLQACAEQGSDCLEKWGQEYHADFEYVYLRDAVSIGQLPLTRNLAESAVYAQVYANPTVAVYERK